MLEVVLGIEDMIFLSILAGKLPLVLQPQARRVGLMGPSGTQIVRSAGLAWILRLARALFEISDQERLRLREKSPSYARTSFL